MIDWNVVKVLEGSPWCWGVGSDSQQLIGKKTANFVDIVLNRLPSVSWCLKQMGGAASSVHTYHLSFCALFPPSRLFEWVRGVRSGGGCTTM